MQFSEYFTHFYLYPTQLLYITNILCIKCIQLTYMSTKLPTTYWFQRGKINMTALTYQQYTVKFWPAVSVAESRRVCLRQVERSSSAKTTLEISFSKPISNNLHFTVTIWSNMVEWHPATNSSMSSCINRQPLTITKHTTYNHFTAISKFIFWNLWKCAEAIFLQSECSNTVLQHWRPDNNLTHKSSLKYVILQYWLTHHNLFASIHGSKSH